MVTKGPTIGGGHLATWDLAEPNAVGETMSGVRAADRTVQFSGTFSGATARLEGSNDGANWATLHDMIGGEIVGTAPFMTLVAENPLYLRAVLVGGADPAVSVTLLSRAA